MVVHVFRNEVNRVNRRHVLVGLEQRLLACGQLISHSSGDTLVQRIPYDKNNVGSSAFVYKDHSKVRPDQTGRDDASFFNPDHCFGSAGWKTGTSYSDSPSTPSNGDTEVLPSKPFVLGLYPIPPSFLFEQSSLFLGFRLQSLEPDVAADGDEDERGEEELLGSTIFVVARLVISSLKQQGAEEWWSLGENEREKGLRSVAWDGTLRRRRRRRIRLRLRLRGLLRHGCLLACSGHLSSEEWAVGVLQHFLRGPGNGDILPVQ